MKRTFAFVLVLIVAIGGAIATVLHAPTNTAESPQTDVETPTNGSDRESVSILSNYGTKIVYTSDADANPAPYEAHCTAQGGTFNTCGTTCAPDTDICTTVCAYTCEGLSDGEEIDTSMWQEYTAGRYGYTVRHPQSWNATSNSGPADVPVLNIVQSDNAAVPIDHHTNTTNLSIFPQGIPREGLFAQTRPFNLETSFPVAEESRVYILEDGTPFAAYIVPENPPSTWNESGFIWLRAHVENLTSHCVRDTVEVPEDVCDPMVTSDEVRRNGTIETDAWQTGLAILRTLSFGPDSAGGDSQALPIRVTAPQTNATLTSPFIVVGEARGTWFFEGSFPVVLTDWDGRIIAETYAQADGEWMTEDFVPFTSEVTFESPYQPGDPSYMARGFLILRKANPSGRPEQDDARELTVQFAPMP